MTDRYLSAYYPPDAVMMWSDHNHVYVGVPSTSGGPMWVTKYPLTEGGLSKALAVLRKPEAHICGTRAPEMKASPLREPKLSKDAVKFNEAQRSATRELLRKRGILK